MDDEQCNPTSDARRQLELVGELAKTMREWLAMRGDRPVNPAEREFIEKMRPLLKQIRKDQLPEIADKLRETDGTK